MSTRPFRRTIPLGILVMVVTACGSSSASTAPSSAASTSPSAAEPSSPTPSSAEPSSEPSASAPSSAIPSFVLPSGAKDLEALLPDQLCGVKATKLSMSGDQFASNADAQFKATLSALGKQPSDVAFAIAIGPGGCTAGIFRIKGVDQNLLQQAFIAQAQKTGEKYTQTSLGGKTVYVSDKAGTKSYAYFKGDAVIFAAAKDEPSVAGILQQLP